MLPLPFPFYSPLLPSPSPYFFFFLIFFNNVCRCSLTISTTSASLLCVRPPSTVLCHSSPPRSLMLLASCLFVFFVLNKRFIQSKFALMSDEEKLGVSCSV
jgi:hypothetical protein